MAQLNPETDFELMFESAPISLWLEDYSALKVLFDSWRALGVTDLSAFVAQTPALLQQCAACLKVLKVNRQTLCVFAANSQQPTANSQQPAGTGVALARSVPR